VEEADALLDGAKTVANGVGPTEGTLHEAMAAHDVWVGYTSFSLPGEQSRET
jgi:hypothetical protein